MVMPAIFSRALRGEFHVDVPAGAADRDGLVNVEDPPVQVRGVDLQLQQADIGDVTRRRSRRRHWIGLRLGEGRALRNLGHRRGGKGERRGEREEG
jgi:hypothetical protein